MGGAGDETGRQSGLRADRLLPSVSPRLARGCFWPQEALPCAAWSLRAGKTSSLPEALVLPSPSYLGKNLAQEIELGLGV